MDLKRKEICFFGLSLNFIQKKKDHFLNLNSKGQSSITDAMYFLIIVMALSSLMFFFSSTYGLNINKYLSQQYKSDFVTSALETILYSSAERDPINTNLENSNELDNFFAALKEDHFANNGVISENMQRIILKRVRSVMRPVASSFDYMFYIFVPPYYYENYADISTNSSTSQPSNVAVLLLKKTNISQISKCKSNGDCSSDSEDYIDYFFCKPPNFQTVSSVLIPQLGEVTKPTENRIVLPLSQMQVKAQVNIMMWIPTSFPKEFEASNQTGGFLGDLNCSKLSRSTNPNWFT